MSPEDAKGKIDSLITAWNQHFRDLKSKQESGQKVTSDDVLAVVLAAGQEVYESGLTPAHAQTLNYKTEEFGDIYKQITERKQPAYSVVGGYEDIEVNAVQAAALKTAAPMERNGMLLSIKADPDFLPSNMQHPIKRASGENSAAKQNLTPAYLPPRDLFEKLAPPEDVTSSTEPGNVDHYIKQPISGGQYPGGGMGAEQELMQMPVRVVMPNSLPAETDKLGPL